MTDEEVFAGLVDIFVPQAGVLRRELFASGGRLAHYTTAENALRILKGKQVWLRNVKFMNDFSEVDHGLGMLRRFFDPKQPDIGRNALIETLNALQPSVFEQAIAQFNGIMDRVTDHTYITCLSKHDPEEDDIGRLSMWRGYGKGAAPVAIVIKTHTFVRLTDELGVFSSPVIYQRPDQFYEVMQGLPERLRANEGFLRAVDGSWLPHMLLQMLITYAISQKHRGFAEEKEWRILHVLGHHPKGILEEDVESVGGMPQSVLKLTLENPASLPDAGISVPELLDRIIVGPAEFPDGIAEGLVAVLRKLGVPDAASKVVVSDIPLRV